MSQHAGSAEDEGIQLTYSGLPPGKRPHTPPAALPHDGGERQATQDLSACRGKPGCTPYHRMFAAAFRCALFAVGVLLGTDMSRYAASLRSSSLPARASLHTPPTAATVLGGVPDMAATLDARFAIVTLGIRCLRDRCDAPDATQYVPAGQRIYALRGGWSCTTLSAAAVVGHLEQHVYCRLDQPNVFTATFDGAPFDCVGSRLGCQVVLRVETTNGR